MTTKSQKKTGEVPFCDECKHAVHECGWLPTSAGEIPSRVREVKGVLACNGCPHHTIRTKAIEAYYASLHVKDKTEAA